MMLHLVFILVVNSSFPSALTLSFSLLSLSLLSVSLSYFLLWSLPVLPCPLSLSFMLPPPLPQSLSLSKSIVLSPLFFLCLLLLPFPADQGAFIMQCLDQLKTDWHLNVPDSIGEAHRHPGLLECGRCRRHFKPAAQEKRKNVQQMGEIMSFSKCSDLD